MNGKFGRIDPAVTLINRLRHSRTQSSAKKRAQYEASSALNGHNISISTLCPDKISGFQANNVKTRPMSAPSARRQSTGSLHSTNRNYKVTPEPSRECTEMKAESSRPNANSARCTRAVDVPVQVLRERGNALFQEQNYTDACTAYTRALELNPNFVMLYCNRAAAYLMLRKYHLALTDSVKVIELDPTNVKGHWRAGKAHLFMESYALARTFYLNARRIATNMQDVVAIDAEVKVIEWVELCRSKLNGKEWESALNLSNQILSVFPRNAPCNVPWECMHLEALIHLNQEKANQLLQNLFSTAPDFAEVWYLQAKWIFLTLTDTTSTEKALECLRKALNLGPTTCDSKVKHLMNAIESFQQLRDEGNSAYHSGNWNRAHSAYTRALEIDLGSAQLKSIILCNRAAVLMQSGKWLDSLEDINNAIRINPLHVKALVRRARIWQHFHRFQDAVKDLNDACVLSPTVENKAKLEHAKLLNHKSQTSNAKNFKESRYRYQSDKISVPNKIYYDIIGAPVNANMQSLTKHYRIAAFKWHPDKWIESDEQERERAETLFKKINHAYTFLKEHLQKSKSFADQ